MILIEKIEKIVKKGGFENYRSSQILHAIFKQGIDDFDKINNIPQGLKKLLKNSIILNSLTLVKKASSKDKSAEKYVFETEDKKRLETVLMSYKDNRNTVCLSSQIGCRLGCKFCATGRLGFGRNLSYGEICDQVLYINCNLIKKNRKISNVVYMGMGEPFMNFDNVINSIKTLNDPLYFGIGARNITVSTAGIPDKIINIADLMIQLNLAISLHAPNQKIRENIMPAAKLYPLDELMAAAQYYIKKTNRRITYEYILLNNINDSSGNADELIRLLKDQLCHVNLIPYNATDIEGITGSPKNKLLEFRKKIAKAGIPVTIRLSLGQDIYAACGQLANK